MSKRMFEKPRSLSPWQLNNRGDTDKPCCPDYEILCSSEVRAGRLWLYSRGFNRQTLFKHPLNGEALIILPNLSVDSASEELS